MAAVEEVSTAVAACTPAAEADPTEGRIQGLRPATEVHRLARLPLRGRGADTRRGRVTTIPVPAVISQAVINDMEIPRRVHLRLPTGSGIRLRDQAEAVDLRA